LDDPSLSGIAIIIVLIIVHGFITLIYAAFNNARQSWLKEQLEGGNTRAQSVLDLAQKASTVLVMIQIIHIILRFSIATIMVLNVVNPMLDGDSQPLVYVVAVLITAMVTLIFGELVPEAIGSSYPNAITMWTSDIMRLLTLVFSPLVYSILFISRFISALMGVSNLVNAVTEEEIMTLVDAGHSGGTIEDEEKEMIFSVLQLNQTRASEVMVPRIDMVAIDLEQTIENAGRIFIESGFSRIPVYEDNIDQVHGLLYAKDLLEHWYGNTVTDEELTIRQLMREVSFVPETRPADELLKDLQTRNVHMAVVQDEYGGTAGLVTIENIIEEIIGDIRDEFDIHEEFDFEKIGTDEYIMDSSIDLDDFNNMLEVDLPAEDNDTLGGYIYSHFERVPKANEVIETDELTIRIQVVEGRRIRKIHVIRKRADTDQSSDESKSDQAGNSENEPPVKIVESQSNDG